MVSGSAPIERVSVRAVFGIVAALGVFAATIATLGLVVAALLTVFTACLIEPKLRWLEVVLLSAGVSFVSIVLFVRVLRIPFQVWPV
jgi:putative tricarboxylic transport membrane protein